MTARLARAALDDWETIDGYVIAHNMPALSSLDQDRFSNFMWWWLTHRIEHSEEGLRAIDKLRTELWRPPAGTAPDSVPASSPWSAENEMAAFNELRSQLGT